MPGYDYYGYDMNMYGYYGGRYGGGGNFYEHPGRGRSAGMYYYIIRCITDKKSTLFSHILA